MACQSSLPSRMLSFNEVIEFSVIDLWQLQSDNLRIQMQMMEERLQSTFVTDGHEIESRDFIFFCRGKREGKSVKGGGVEGKRSTD